MGLERQYIKQLNEENGQSPVRIITYVRKSNIVTNKPASMEILKIVNLDYCDTYNYDLTTINSFLQDPKNLECYNFAKLLSEYLEQNPSESKLLPKETLDKIAEVLNDQ